MYVKQGDLIKLALAGEFDVIVHGCNCHCQMGRGIGYPKIGAGLAGGDRGIIYPIICQELAGEYHTYVEFRP